MKNSVVVVMVTTPVNSSKKIIDVLLKKKLVACVNEIKNIVSVYWWENKICNDKESLLIIKTQKILVSKLIQEIKKIHPYKTPEIIVLPVVKGNKDYLQWVKNTTSLYVST